MRFKNRSYRSVPPCPSDHKMVGELESPHHAPRGVLAYAIPPVASGGVFNLCDDDAVSITLADESQLLATNVVHSNGSQALIGHYLVDMLPQSDLPSVEEYFAASGRQVLPLVGVVHLEPSDILGVTHTPLMCVPGNLR